ncbi:DNA polymerase III subunit beta [Novosphingobium sp.]|uniref:DNA polymerase III subunit beta n=1 Tax=Novosphingobium sp. TaxID=1874826 RepID=UPI00286E3BF1|nr:DNA polymerase III subunit beta [Novosphingobium sp.]
MELSNIDTATAQASRAAFTCEPGALHAAAAFLAKRIIEKRQTVPIFASVRITADLSGVVTLTGSDTDAGVYASVTVPGEVESPGALCVDAAVFADAIAKAAKDKDCGQVRIAEEVIAAWNGEKTGRAIVTARRNRLSLPTLPADDFPTPAGGIEPTLSAFKIDAPQFLSDLAALAPCIGKEENRHYLHGIAIERREMAGRDRFVMAATDGHGMAIASRPLPDSLGELPQAILPGKAVSALIAAGKLAGGAAMAGSFTTEGEAAFRFELGNVSIYASPIDETYPDFMRVFTDAMAPTGAQECLFPDLLPGAPVAMLEKLAKPFKGGLTWAPAKQGFLGTVAGDDGLLFAVMSLADADDCGKKGFSYTANGSTGEVTGPDGITYPVAFSADKIHLSAAQLRALIGESIFETMLIAAGLYILQWCWDNGDGRFLLVGKDGRIRGDHRTYITRTEVEAMLAGEVAPPADMPEIPASAGAGERVEAPDAPMGQIDADALSEAPSARADVMGESHDYSPDPIAELAARLASLESRVATLSGESIASEALIPSGNLPGNYLASPTVARRTPAHERAVRRAWAERAKVRATKSSEAAAWFQARLAQDTNRNNLRSAQHWREKCEAITAKRRRAVMFARDLQKRLSAEHRLVDRANERRGTAEAQAAAQMQRAMVAEAALTKSRADLADPHQPERESDLLLLKRQRDDARAEAERERNAAAAVNERNTRLQSVMADLGERFEVMAGRVARAEAALRVQGAVA